MSRAARTVVIGASAGAFESLSGIIPKLPKDFPAPIVIVVHLPPDKRSVMAELFAERSSLIVKEAEDKEDLLPGTVYFAPPDYHLLIEENASISLSSEEPVQHSRPSIDVLFETAADALGDSVIGIVLSGANSDGSKGLKAILAAGGTGLVQSPDTSYATAMPEAALALAQGAKSLSLDQITTYLRETVS